MKLTGEGQQIIRNGASYSGESIRFAHLYIEQPESGSTVLESGVTVTGSVNHVSNNITGVTCLDGAKIVGDALYGDVKIASDYSFEADVTLHGNAYWGAEDKKISINNCHVTVTGNLNDTGLTPVFTGEQALLTVTGDYILERYSYTTFESGIIQIGGDLKKNGDASISFGENAELQFIGKSVQTVSASHSNTLLTNVVVDNPEGVVVEDNIAVMNVSCKQGVLSYASGAVHGFTLEEDGEYEGDLVIGGGVLDLNGHNYHVKGNLTIANGALNMTNAADYLIVDGDFTTSSTIDHSPKLTAGTMEVKGNFTQKGGKQSFAATENHTVLFSGTSQQMVNFANTGTSNFCNLANTNTEGVVFDTDVKVIGNVKQSGKIEGNLCISSTTTFDSGCYQGDIKIAEEVTLSENCKIDGQLLVCNKFDLNGKELELSGKVSIVYSYSYLYFNHGKLSCNSFETQHMESHISMSYEDDHLCVLNDFTVKLRYGSFYNGSITVGGNVNVNIAMGENVILEMNGEKQQTITMLGTDASFGTLMLNNTSEEGIHVSNELNYKKLINTAGTKVTFPDGGLLGYTLTKDEVVEGDFLLSGGDMDLNGHSLTVKGDFVQSGGSLYLHAGNLLVEGDYSLAKRTKQEDGTYAYENTAAKLYMDNTEDCITVKGNFHTAVSDSDNWLCSAGTIRLAGNLTVWNDTSLTLEKDMILLLDGEKQQQFTFNNYHISLGGFFVENKDGVAFPDGAHAQVKGVLSTNGYPVDGCLDIYSDVSLNDDVIRGNLDFSTDYNLNKDLYVKGNVRLDRFSLNGYHLTVDGNCSLYNDTVIQTDGILEVKGDLLCSEYDCEYLGRGTNQVVLSGEKKQTIQSTDLNWQFQELVIKNTSDEGVYATGLFDAEKITDTEHKLSFYTEGEVGYTLTKDTVIQGDFNLLTGIMDLNGHTLTVIGNFMQRGGIMDINAGRLEVYGDYTLGNPDASGKYQNNHAKIYMDESADYVLCGGDLILATGASFNEHLQKGTIEIKGNLECKYAKYELEMNKDVTIQFTGEERQEIINEQKRDYFYLGSISLENTSAEGVVIKDDMEIINPVTGNGKLTGTEGKTVYWRNGKAFPFTQWTGNLNLQTAAVMTNDLTVDGALTLNNKTCRRKKLFHSQLYQCRQHIRLSGVYRIP